MVKNIKGALEWRYRRFRYRYWKSAWQIRNCIDFPYKEEVKSISVVVVGRNDNYGGDFSKRLQVTLDWNLKLLPNPELIYVEWNQIKERKSDCTWIAKRYAHSKCYIVTEKVHNSLCSDPQIPVLEYHAKNVGIRRSSHEWILIINADVFMGPEIAKRIRRLNRGRVYGTHYNNISWSGEPIRNFNINNPSILLNMFPATNYLGSVVGNFILTHKRNWLKATGYDENLTNVRLGVDENGLQQLLHFGLKPMALGEHYHLDHAESAINGPQLTHGISRVVDKGLNIPYKDNAGWGLVKYKEKKVGNRIWRLERN